jgi:hypothetical protein
MLQAAPQERLRAQNFSIIQAFDAGSKIYPDF